jgi:hypothetical protein
MIQSHLCCHYTIPQGGRRKLSLKEEILGSIVAARTVARESLSGKAGVPAATQQGDPHFILP